MTAATTNLPVEPARVVVVGGGPSGLTAAAALAGRPAADVLLLERGPEAGGIPLACDHGGFGLRDLRRALSGPAYARRLVTAARGAGVRVETESQVTGWDGGLRLLVTSPRGRRVVEAEAVVLATGARERPRAGRLIAGDRPDGVLTTNQLQQVVHAGRRFEGRRAVVVGAELVSWSAVLTLRSSGARTVAMTTTYERSEAFAAVGALGRWVLRVPVVGQARVVHVHGHERLDGVTVEHVVTGRRTRIPCDLLVTTGDWVPEHELVRTGGLALDGATRGPRVDDALRTSASGVFAVGNLVHPVDTADAAALDGRHVRAAVEAWLAGDPPPGPGIPLEVRPPLRWVVPQVVHPGERAARGDLLLWSQEYRRLPVVRAVQEGRLVGRRRSPWPAAPGRVFRVPDGLVAGADPEAGPVTIELG